MNNLLNKIKVGQIWKNMDRDIWIYIIRTSHDGFHFIQKRIPERWESKFIEYSATGYIGKDEEIMEHFDQYYKLIGKSKAGIDDLFERQDGIDLSTLDMDKEYKVTFRDGKSKTCVFRYEKSEFATDYLAVFTGEFSGTSDFCENGCWGCGKESPADIIKIEEVVK